MGGLTKERACVCASYLGCRLTLQAKAKKNRSGEKFQVHTTDFLFAKTSLRFCLFLANDSNEHSQLNTIKCDYNGHTLATVQCVLFKSFIDFNKYYVLHI